MLTNNFKKIVATLLQANGTLTYGGYPIKNAYGTTVYTSGNFSQLWPRAAPAITLVSSAIAAGIAIGTGSTPASGDDYRIESPIASGISASITYAKAHNDVNGYDDIEFTIVVTNSSGADIVAREISYTQNIYCASSQGGSTGSGQYICLDRTVFDTPITLVNGEQTTIKYRLRSILSL